MRTNLKPVEDAADQELNVESEGWDLEFRRPSNIRLFSHAFEWAGYSNYTKAVPKYQQFMSQTNKFTYYFTHQDGGRVYCSGFNEEGFLVTNRGIQDLSTGDTVQLDNIGAPDVSLQPESKQDVATTEVTGIVEIATCEEAEKAIDGDVVGKNDNGATRVVDVDCLGKIKDAIIDQVEQDIKVLPDELSVIFVRQNVERENGAELATVVPDDVTRAFNDKGYKPGTPAAVAFRSLKQAFDFINGRSPVGEDKLTCYILGEVTNDSDAEGGIKVLANKRTIIRGYDTNRTGNKCVIGGRVNHGANNLELQIIDCTLSVGTKDNYIDQTYCVESRGLKLYVRNAGLHVFSTGRSAQPISQYYAPENAVCEMVFRSDFVTEIFLEGMANGPAQTTTPPTHWFSGTSQSVAARLERTTNSTP